MLRSRPKRPSTGARRALQRERIPLRSFLSEDATNIYTTMGTLELRDGAYVRAAVDCRETTGTNACGHSLSAGSGAD